MSALDLFLRAIDLFLLILIALIILNAVLSWLPVSRSNNIIKGMRGLVEPILQPIRKMIKKSIFGGSNMALDFSPFIAYLVISMLRRTLSVVIGDVWWIF